MWNEFKKFAMRGNVVDLAVGIIIGIAFGSIVNSLVADVIMPPIGLILGKVDFANLYVIIKEGTTAGPYASLDIAKEKGAITINYGKFINTIINFIIVAFSVFLMIRAMNKLTAKDKTPAPSPTTKECPYCFSTIPLKAIRCPSCTSDLRK